MASDTDRITSLEEFVSLLQIAVSNLASKQQVRQLLLLRQEEITSLTARVAELERVITLLENNVQ
jgi:polyhydroxyalkanoate synthesis regulator phasin